jgi:glucoside 3-dehydrogenase (cytochrome c) hitch-hiker subunit
MKRRDFLECVALLVGGVTASQAGFALTSEQQVYLATAPNFIDKGVSLFSEEQRFIVAEMAEQIMPETDTPGAKQAGVPKFIELMVTEWLNDEERKIFMKGLEALPSIAENRYGKGLKSLNEQQVLEILEALEEDASGDPWFSLANLSGAFGDEYKSPFICQLKELTIYGFFTSEVGSKKVLRYNPMPMKFEGDIPLVPNESAWAGKMI